MIVTIPLVLALCVYIKDVSSASFSKVFVQNLPEHPVEYVQYGAPSVSYSPQIAQLTAAPVGSVVPYSSNYVPCGTPCVYPGQVASIASSPNIIQYQNPSLPVVVAPSRTEPSGYEYSYVVYDEDTGDHKAQRESSDGTVVRGGYSFLQPDGLVREVQYVADDSQGFNAVVKNYVPITVEAKKPEHADKEPAPCPDVKNEHLTHDHEITEETGETAANHEHKSQDAEPSHENLKVQAEASVDPKEGHAEESIAEHTEEEHLPKKAEIPEDHHEINAEAILAPAPSPAESFEKSEESHVIHMEPEIHENHEHHTAVADPTIENSNILVPYNDIIRCVQAAINGVNEVSSTHRPESPLTYIILNKPC